MSECQSVRERALGRARARGFRTRQVVGPATRAGACGGYRQGAARVPLGHPVCRGLAGGNDAARAVGRGVRQVAPTWRGPEHDPASALSSLRARLTPPVCGPAFRGTVVATLLHCGGFSSLPLLEEVY